MLAYEGKQVLVRDCLGMEYIRMLLENEGRQVDVESLDRHASARMPRIRAGDDSAIDGSARQQYEDSLKQLGIELEDARTLNDQAAIDRISGEIHQVADILRSGTGISGTARPLTNDRERVRARVAGAMQTALDRIKIDHKPLHRHLRDSIRTPTGRSPSYNPDKSMNWSLGS